jgi:hypothetical protein
MTPDAVFVLQHAYELDNGTDEVKMIGVYTSQQAAESAILRLRKQPGFAAHPDGFHISRYELNKDHWTEGFVRA